MLRTRRGEDYLVLDHMSSHVLHSRTALQCASYGGFADTMSLLLEAQADPNLQDNEVRSMLTSVLGQLMLMGSLLHSFIIKSLVLVIKQIFNKINLLTRI